MGMSKLEQYAFRDNPGCVILRKELGFANFGFRIAPDYLRVNGILPEQELIGNKGHLG
jgi:hypothetical protein